MPDERKGRLSVAEIRRSFDAEFASPRALPDEQLEDLLAIRLAGDPYALKLSDVELIDARRKIVPLRGADASVLGVAGVRGQLVAVYDLARLLGYGYARARSHEAPRWIAVVDAERGLAVAFDELEAQFSAAPLRAAADGRTQWLDGTVEHEGVRRPVVAMASFRAAIVGARLGARGA